jgi:hypothetical protein
MSRLGLLQGDLVPFADPAAAETIPVKRYSRSLIG